MTTWKKMKQLFHTIYENQFQITVNLIVKGKMIKFPESNIENLHNLGVGGNRCF